MKSTAPDDTGIKLTVYPDEFKPLLKVLNFALAHPDQVRLNQDEMSKLWDVQDSVADLSLEYGI